MSPRSPIVLERTYSLLETREMLGVGDTTLHALLNLGRKYKGLHPLKGGLWPSYKLSHKKRRVPESALARHIQHMFRLENEPMFAAEMRAKARGLTSTGGKD